MASEKVVLNLEKRELVGRKAAKVRQAGQTPGVVYGKGVEPIAVQAPAMAVAKVIHQVGRRQSLELDIDGKKRIAIIKSISRHPAKDVVQNVEFHAINRNEKVVTEVPVVLEGSGESVAERAGLVVLQAIEQLAIKALPKNLPEHLMVSIIELAEAGQHITVADIQVPEGVELETDDMQAVVASVYEPAALQAANDAAGGDAEADEESEVAAENGEESEAAEETEQKES